MHYQNLNQNVSEKYTLNNDHLLFSVHSFHFIYNNVKLEEIHFIFEIRSFLKKKVGIYIFFC